MKKRKVWQYMEKIEKVQRDRLGIYIGRARVYEGIKQEVLAEGICRIDVLSRIESGEREADKMLIDVLLQRLGKPVEQFVRLLDVEEARSLKKRETIQNYLREGNLPEAEKILAEYYQRETGILQKQFAMIMEINLRYYKGEEKSKLSNPIMETLQLTQPNYGKRPLSELLFSRNEMNLLLSWLEIQEQMNGSVSTIENWRELLAYFDAPRYTAQERVRFSPYIAKHIAEYEYQKGNSENVLVLCNRVIKELEEEEKLFGYEELLELKAKAQETMGISGEESSCMAADLRELRSQYAGKPQLWIQYDEKSSVYVVNQVIRQRRGILGLSQEELAEGICDATTLWRIENKEKKVQRKNRIPLLKKVGLSGERYEYEIITEDFEDYQRRAKLDRACSDREWEQAWQYLEEMRGQIPQSRENLQYIMLTEIDIKEKTIEEKIEHLEKILRMTFPVLTDEIVDCRETDPLNCEKCEHPCHLTMLSIQESLILGYLASTYKHQGKHGDGIRIMRYVKRCMEHTEFDLSNYEDVYNLCVARMTSMLGDIGKYEESDRLARVGIRLSFERNTNHLPMHFLFDLAWNKEQQENKKSLLLYKQAELLAKLGGDKTILEYIQNYIMD